MKATFRSAPLSSLDSIPVTEETAARMRDHGLADARIESLSEMGAQALLALKEGEGTELAAPTCHRKEYAPESQLCQGCVFAPSCWYYDTGYLKRLRGGQAPSPVGVPVLVVRGRLEGMAALLERSAPPPPPKKGRRAPPPPPPPRKR